jgi:hypothetical protein
MTKLLFLGSNWEKLIHLLLLILLMNILFLQMIEEGTYLFDFNDK